MNSRVIERVTGCDEFGDPTLHRLSGFIWMGRFMQAGLERREVPGEFWTLTGDEAAAVSCPCGAEPVVEVAQFPVRCECARRFFFDGTAVWALLSPNNAPEAG